MALRGGWDIVFIARNPAAQADYKSLKSSVGDLLVRAGLSLGEHEGVGSGVN
jgi:ribonuclease P protein component